MKKGAAATIVLLLLMIMLDVETKVQKAEAPYPIVYIRKDGSIDPSTANITSSDNATYTFTDNLSASIIVERANILIDGRGYILNGTKTGYEYGIRISEKNNITIKNVNVESFYLGIYLNATSHNLIYENNLTGNSRGIWLLLADNNTLTENNIISNNQGIILYRSRDNIISENNVSGNWDHSIYLDMSLNNRIYHNTFLDNGPLFFYQSNNIWDDGYPSGGNYWSDYIEKYPNATEIDDSGVWNTPYVIDENNIDNYPLIPEFPSRIMLSLFMISTLLAGLIYRRRRRQSPHHSS